MSKITILVIIIIFGLLATLSVIVIFILPGINKENIKSECNKQAVGISDQVVKDMRAKNQSPPSTEYILSEINNRVALCMKRKGF